jgi:hypothetical protein
MKYVISYTNHNYRTAFVRWYKDGSTWVERLSAKTATQYDSRELALKGAERLTGLRWDIREV